MAEEDYTTVASVRAALEASGPLVTLVRLAPFSGDDCVRCAKDACAMYVAQYGRLDASYDDIPVFESKTRWRNEELVRSDLRLRQAHALELHECLVGMAMFDGVDAMRTVFESDVCSPALWTMHKMKVLRIALGFEMLATARFLVAVLIDDLEVLLAYRGDTKDLANNIRLSGGQLKECSELAETVAARVFLERNLRSANPKDRAAALVQALSLVRDEAQYLGLYGDHVLPAASILNNETRLFVCREVARLNMLSAGYLLEGVGTSGQMHAPPYVTVSAKDADELLTWSNETQDAQAWERLVRSAQNAPHQG